MGGTNQGIFMIRKLFIRKILKMGININDKTMSKKMLEILSQHSDPTKISESIKKEFDLGKESEQIRRYFLKNISSV